MIENGTAFRASQMERIEHVLMIPILAATV